MSDGKCLAGLYFEHSRGVELVTRAAAKKSGIFDEVILWLIYTLQERFQTLLQRHLPKGEKGAKNMNNRKTNILNDEVVISLDNI